MTHLWVTCLVVPTASEGLLSHRSRSVTSSSTLLIQIWARARCTKLFSSKEWLKISQWDMARKMLVFLPLVWREETIALRSRFNNKYTRLDHLSQIKRIVWICHHFQQIKWTRWRLDWIEWTQVWGRMDRRLWVAWEVFQICITYEVEVEEVMTVIWRWAHLPPAKFIQPVTISQYRINIIVIWVLEPSTILKSSQVDSHLWRIELL